MGSDLKASWRDKSADEKMHLDDMDDYWSGILETLRAIPRPDPLRDYRKPDRERIKGDTVLIHQHPHFVRIMKLEPGHDTGWGEYSDEWESRIKLSDDHPEYWRYPDDFKIASTKTDFDEQRVKFETDLEELLQEHLGISVSFNGTKPEEAAPSNEIHHE